MSVLPLDDEQDEIAKCPSDDTFTGVPVPPLTVPQWQYSGFAPPFKRYREYEALNLLDGEEDIILDKFVIYRDIAPQERRPGFVSLNDVATRQGGATFYFDGILRAGDSGQQKLYVQRIPFSLVSIGGYEDVEQHTVEMDMWIQSSHCKARTGRGDGIWYRLGMPAPEYEPYQRLFVWVANLAKYLVDFLHHHSPVYLSDFESCFHEWLMSLHRADPDFMRWYDAYGKPDLRHAVVAHNPFLQKQAADINPFYLDHPFWAELGQLSNPGQVPPVIKQPTKMESTVVTPYVWRCFKKMPWAEYLQKVELGELYAQHQQKCGQMGFRETRSKRPKVHAGELSLPVPGAGFSVSPGDVIATAKDKQSKWKGGDMWYALVQDIRLYKRRPAKLFVIWLYQPTDTVCANLTYPYPEELFLSDHCNCGDGNFDITQIAKKVSVNFGAKDGTGLFVRQTYNSVDETFTTLKDDDFVCSCRRTRSGRRYEVGDTVLVEGEDLKKLKLEPAEIVGFKEHKVEIRLLPRRDDSPPNELVYTQQFRMIEPDQIHRRCHVRFFSEEDKRHGLPSPYNRDGNGDAFYITNVAPEGFKQGPVPLEAPPRLRGLNIFSGGGNFDRGLEEGMAVQSEWAVEWEFLQMLTYRANHPKPDNLKLFCGSVNDYLHKAIHGGTGPDDELVARLGQVEFLSAGSPCQGYSLVNSQKANVVSMRNSSMIASVAAFVDFYRPKYAILENVIAMAHAGEQNQNPLSQLICAFVGMGYQLRLLNLDAWSFGAPQSRSRLFVIIAAPGLQLPAHPALTHSHPPTIVRRSLGAAPNGLPFGERQWDTPVFDFVTAAESTQDLPSLGEARIMSIPEPDHRPSRTESTFTQTILNHVPRWPRRQGLLHALERGWLRRHKYNKRNLTARQWSRVDPHGFFPTITTTVSPSCRYTGYIVHWAENRLITVKEARRAQGFPDSEVIIGSPAQQWEIIGNSVARQVALALGLTLREAVLQNSTSRDHPGPITTRTTTAAPKTTPAPTPAAPTITSAAAAAILSETETRSSGADSSIDITRFDDEETSGTSICSEPAPVPTSSHLGRKRAIQVLEEVVIPTTTTATMAEHGLKRLKI